MVTDEGAKALLKILVHHTVSGVLPWQLVLYVNDIGQEPSYETTFDDLVEASFSGYARIDLLRNEFREPTLQQPGCAVSYWKDEPQTIWNTGSTTETVYGIAIVEPTTNAIRWIIPFAEEDVAPLVPGARILIHPAFTLNGCGCEFTPAPGE